MLFICKRRPYLFFILSCFISKLEDSYHTNYEKVATLMHFLDIGHIFTKSQIEWLTFLFYHFFSPIPIILAKRTKMLVLKQKSKAIFSLRQT